MGNLMYFGISCHVFSCFRLRKLVTNIEVEFRNLSFLPKKDAILKIAQAALNTNSRKVRDVGTQMNNTVSLQNITYTRKF